MIHFRDLARPVPVPAGSALFHSLCNNSKYVAHEKVDGMRVMVRNQTLTSRHGKAVEPGRELAQAMASLPRDWIFDAELLDGKLFVFDLLHRESDGWEPITNMHLGYRWMVLSDKLVPSPWINRVRVSTNKERAYRDWVGMGAEGMVLKCMNDAYPPLRGAEWYKVKPCSE